MDQAMPLQLANLLQYQSPERSLHFTPSFDDALRAALLGLDSTTYRASRTQCEETVREAARELLAEPSLAARVDRLPFAADATVIGIGDSFTDDFLSWLEILRHLLELRRPHDNIRVLNAAAGGQTTSLLLGRFLTILEQRPDWILCLVGINDALRIGSPASKTLVSVEETSRNLAALRRLAAETAAQWVWLTPPAIYEERIIANSFLKPLRLSWRNDDLEAIAVVVRRQPGVVVDVRMLFRPSAAVEFLSPDGIHPSLAGHKGIARALIERLTS